jgi:hypothetical protein
VRSLIDQVDGWDNAELARNAIHNVSKSEDAQSYLNDLAIYWARDLNSHWDLFCKHDYATCEKLVDNHNVMLTSGIFIGPQKLLSGAVINFNSNGILSTVQAETGTQMSKCWSCGQLQPAMICAAGDHLDAVANFCSKRKHGDKIDVHTPLRNQPSKSTELAVKIVEMIIDAY